MKASVEAARAAAAARVAEPVRAVLPDARVRVDGDGLVIEARGLKARWIADARLRWIAEELT